ncbi:MAG: hypothetical protein CVU44_10320 [Chloroflexi bacterium HGW-Chloroflexi-6]|nr:MAG: hypothetical protein CVU44_10320 [Chloroflexi bacterium HGW-Chloroflexi-6]
MKKQFHILLTLLVLISFFVASCDVLEDEEVYEEEPVAEESYEEEDYQEPASEDAVPPAEDIPSERPGTVIYDLGFRPDQNGFSFENYGDDIQVTNLTADEMRRMFGDQVCSRLKDDQCTLTPPAKQWMEQINDAMAGGHCEGMAVLSLMMYAGQITPDQFGGSVAGDLDINDETLQREIAYWWATQATAPTAESVIRGTPMEIMETIQEMDANGETYTIGIYKEDFSGGHAITPFGVKDVEDGLYTVLVYDNNYPGQVRELLIDSRDNSWAYEAATNPDVESELYTGNADTQTLDLTPTSSRLGEQQCPFCEEGNSSLSGAKLAAPAQAYNQIFLDGKGHILITDDEGNRLGYVDNKIVNEIPGASYNAYRMGASMEAPDPIYSIPDGINVTVTIDGNALDAESETDLVLIGPGFSIGVEEIILEPGQVDTVTFLPNDQMIIYDTDQDESPFIVVSIEDQAGADYYFEVQGMDMQGGGEIYVSLDTKAGDLLIGTEKLTNEGDFALYIERFTDDDEEEFYAEGIMLQAGATIYVNYAEWTDATPEGLYIDVDLDGDGEPDDQYDVSDSE